MSDEETNKDSVQARTGAAAEARRQRFDEAIEAGRKAYREEKARVAGGYMAEAPGGANIMAEEIEKTTEKEPTAAEVAERLENAKRGPYIIEEYPFSQQTRSLWRVMHPSQKQAVIPVVNWEGRIMFYRFVSNVDVAANANELALGGGNVAIGSGSVVATYSEAEEPVGAPTRENLTDEEATTRILIGSAIADVETSRMLMRRDDEEIQRLKEETRAILAKLAA